MGALDVHLQVGRIPPLRHDRNRALVPDLSRRNRPRGPRPFGIHAIDRLCAERFGFGVCIRQSSFPVLEGAEHDITRPAWSAFHLHSHSSSPSHPHVTGHLPRYFLVGQRLRRLRNCNGAERRSLHYFPAMQSTEAEQLKVIYNESHVLAHHASLDCYWAWAFLCSNQPTLLDHYRAWGFLCFLCSH